MILLEGKPAAAAIKADLSKQVNALIQKKLRPPHLVAVLIGNNGASETYVASKIKNCEEIGFQSSLIRFETSVPEDILLQKLEELNNDDTVDGMLVQLPLPKHISEEKVINTITPEKDVDGFHPVNLGRLAQGAPTFIPATPYGIILLMQHYGIHAKGKHAVVIGRSNIVGRPISILLSSNQPYGNATVTICHSHTPNLKELSLQADILVAALGKPGFVTADMIKEGAVIIDVGITRVEDTSAKKGFRIKGDVNFDEAAAKASYITPVPGGVGLMTIAALLKNTVTAYLKRHNLSEAILSE
ncbi:bifunctional 5,10-methylenetetrahydrofolate dehydrogenase/5,10-methenyltetrahydrofolate cyclohydrolase [Parafilimonas sp.]|uniref:bifunctional 5,10-methylenetetrahydrofolate dehydrogenase/5,10-methenyltetrahydrofolate cyclohydrolase n=1 Tax=Parafilimonas sp. TaxID=1969739 RepID=UPI0039E5B326